MSNSLSCAGRWKEIGASFSLGWLGGFIADLIQIGNLGASSARLNNPSSANAVEAIAARTDPRRLYELLGDKLKLFDGVFGSSDEMLGVLEGGLDFERRVLSIYQGCREPDEIGTAGNDALPR